MSTKFFVCKFCNYQVSIFLKYLSHIWNKHSLQTGFSVSCSISNCPSKFTSIRSFKKHIRAKHPFFHQKHFYTLNINEAPPDDRQNQEVPSSNSDDEDRLESKINNLDFDDTIAELLLELRENTMSLKLY